MKNSSLSETQGARAGRAWTMKDTSIGGHINELVGLIRKKQYTNTHEPILMREPGLDSYALSKELESVLSSMGHYIYSNPREVTFTDAAHEAACVARLNALLAQTDRIARTGAEAFAGNIDFYEAWLTCVAPCAALFLSVDDAEQAGEDACRLNLNDAPLGGELSQIYACPNLLSIQMAGHSDDGELDWPIPIDFSLFARLRSLTLSENGLPELPESVLGCGALEVLSIHSNQIRVLPEDIDRLTSLRWLDLRRNPIEYGEMERARALLKDCEIIVDL